jgi:hypothetical protein
MNCPNCGLANPDNAKFCGNCGTRFGATSQPQQPSYQVQPPTAPPIAGPGNPLLKNLALGCLVALLIFLFITFSCTRACSRSRRHYRRYGVVTRPVPYGAATYCSPMVASLNASVASVVAIGGIGPVPQID